MIPKTFERPRLEVNTPIVDTNDAVTLQNRRELCKLPPASLKKGKSTTVTTTTNKETNEDPHMIQ